MSALALDPNEMSSDLRSQVYRIVENAVSTIRANAYIDIYEVFVDGFEDAYYEEYIEAQDAWTEESLNSCQCLYCGDSIDPKQLLERLYLFESGKPAFYMCFYCEKSSVEFGDGHDVPEDDE